MQLPPNEWFLYYTDPRSTAIWRVSDPHIRSFVRICLSCSFTFRQKSDSKQVDWITLSNNPRGGIPISMNPTTFRHKWGPLIFVIMVSWEWDLILFLVICTRVCVYIKYLWPIYTYIYLDCRGDGGRFEFCLSVCAWLYGFHSHPNEVKSPTISIWAFNSYGTRISIHASVHYSSFWHEHTCHFQTLTWFTTDMVWRSICRKPMQLYLGMEVIFDIMSMFSSSRLTYLRITSWQSNF